MTHNGVHNGTVNPPESQGGNRGIVSDDRDEAGRFTEGHSVGKLTRFRPGESGNPNGRPRSAALTDLVRRRLQMAASTMPQAKQLAAKLEHEADEVTIADLVIEALMGLAINSDLDAIKTILDRVDGKTLARVEASVNHGPTVVIQGIDPRKAFGGRFSGSRE